MNVKLKKKCKKIIKDLYETGELDKIINMPPECDKIFNDEELLEFERKRAQELKDTFDIIGMDIEDMPIIPLIVSCQSILFLQTLVFRLLEGK